MYEGGDSFQNEMYSNIPNMSLAFTMYSSMFGNGAFIVQPPMPGDVSDTFPTIPYLSLEALLYQQQASNPMSSPFTTYGGASASQQVVGGTQVVNDGTGTPRALTGNQSTV